MALFEWDASYELDIPLIDNQHKGLVRMMNDLYDSIKTEQAPDMVNRILSQLLEYVDVHFDAEELSMREMGYPNLKGHLALHEDLRRKVLGLNMDQLRGREVATFELLNFLVDWLKEHIANEDRLIGEFLYEKRHGSLPD